MLAGEQLVAEGSFETAGIADIARLADSSVGSFYRIVGDKDTLLRAVHERFVADARDRIARGLDPAKHTDADLAQVLQVFVALMVDIYMDREGMIRALIVRSSSEPEFRERIGALREDIRLSFGQLVVPRAAQIGHPNPLGALAFGSKVLLGTLNHATVVQSLEPEGRDHLIAELTGMLVRYLQVR